ncbi:MAG: type II secretion system protein GspC [Desulfobacteraceae bacterium]|nr:type II secretion system protein GspC [Desulfobacteraceae bacterium]
MTVALYFCTGIMYKRIETATYSPPDLSRHEDKGGQERQTRDGKKLSAAQSRSITARNLFKASVDPGKEEKTAPDLDLENLEEFEKTKLNLKLWGTVSGVGSRSFAVIQERSSRTQALYHEGDSVSGAEIRKIRRSSVILNYKGKNQILEMETTAPKGRRRSSTLRSPKISSSSMTIQRSAIDEAMGDMESLMKQVRVRPHFSKGKPDGLLLYGIKNNALFKKMGLRNGDIIMGVDGKEITSIDDALSLYQGLRQASEANIKLKRRGKIKEINYHVQQ